MKNILLVTVATLAFSGTAQATETFNTTFTGDNYVTQFEYIVDGQSTVIDLDNYNLVENSNNSNNNWRVASSFTINNMAVGTNYDFIWQVDNDLNTGHSNGNPAAFLAEFNFQNQAYLTSDDATWSVSNDGINWWDASLANYRSQDLNAFNGGDNIWSDSNGQISGISGNAQWIWDSANGSSINYDSLYLKASITSAVPEPSTYLLMLAGLSFVGFISRRRQK